tara:strand:+ start:1399 stop:2277 length:879 start_codon:yes stop_codon:yes gene_type:complete
MTEAEFYEQFPEHFTPFDTRVMELAGDFVHELETAISYGMRATLNDPQARTRVEYLRTELQLPDFDPVVAAELRKLLPAKALVESNWNAGLVSGSGARGILQFMPGTWAEHGNDGNILSLRDQVVATDSLLRQIHFTLQSDRYRPALDRIEAIFFNGDRESFLRDFYTLCVQSCFNAGAGNLGSVLEGFANEFRRADDVHRKLSAHGLSVAGRDVYALMTQLERLKDWDPQYEAQSINYVYKLYAARAAIDQGWSPGLRQQLMGELPDGSHPAVDATAVVGNQSGAPQDQRG